MFRSFRILGYFLVFGYFNFGGFRENCLNLEVFWVRVVNLGNI